MGLALGFQIPVQAQQSQTDRLVITPDNISEINLLSQYQSHTSRIRGITFSSDGSRIITMGRDDSDFDELVYFDVESEQIISTGDFSSQVSPWAIFDIQFFNNSDNLMVTTDGAVFVWNTQNSQPSPTTTIVQSFASASESIGANRILVASGETGLLGIWSVATEIPSQPLDSERSDLTNIAHLLMARQLDTPISDIAYDEIHQQIFVLGTNGNLYQFPSPPGYSLSDPEIVAQPASEVRPETIARANHLIALAPETQWVAYAGSYRNVIIQDYVEDRLLSDYSLESPVICLVSSPNHRILVIGENAPEAELIFIDTLTFQEVNRINTEAPIQDCTYSPDGTLLATANTNGEVYIWGISSDS
jgi:WD40 repeat protein